MVAEVGSRRASPSYPNLVAEVRWLDEVLQGALVQDARQPERQQLVLSFRAPGRTWHLAFQLRRELCTLHTVERPPPNPRQPHGFQGLLRRDLRGRIERVSLHAGDRVVRFDLAGGGGDAGAALMVELFPPQPEAMLLDSEGRVLGTTGLRRRFRPCTRPGERWAPPDHAVQTERAPDGASGEAIDAALREAALHWLTRHKEDERLRMEAERQRVGRKRDERLLRHLLGELPAPGDAERARHEAILLQTWFSRIPRDGDRVALPDVLHEGESVEVPITPGLTPAEQVRRRFRLAARLDRRLRELPARISEIESRLAAASRPGPPAPTARKGPGPPLVPVPSGPIGRRWRSQQGVFLTVGGSAAENDALTWGRARPDHWWLHVRDRPGPHVVAFTTGSLDEGTRELAAQLAAIHAGLTDGERVDVDLCRVRDLRRPRAAAPGMVMVLRTQPVTVRVDRRSCERLGDCTAYWRSRTLRS